MGKGHARLEDVPLGSAGIYYGEDARPASVESVTARKVDRAAIEEELRKAGYNPDDIDLGALLQQLAGRQP